MTPEKKIQSDVTRLSALSTEKPDFYFIHGFLTGLSGSPDPIPNSSWQAELFGEFSFDSEDHLNLMPSLIELYNSIIKSAMNRNLKMPIQCSNLDFQLEGSLFTGQPLPQWSCGFINALDLFDYTRLNESQAAIIAAIEEDATSFISYADLRAATAMAGDNWKMFVTQMRIDLEDSLDVFIGILRFGEEFDFEEFDRAFDELGEPGELDVFDEDDDDAFDFDPSDDEEAMAELEAMFEMVMTENSPEAFAMLEEMIQDFEDEVGPNHFENRDADFWEEDENDSYMILRRRRAIMHFENRRIAAAIAELEELLRLNPSDTIENRFALSSMLVITRNWERLKALIERYDDSTVAMLAAKALMLYANAPTNPEAKAAKNALKKVNKYVVKYLTGQKKPKGKVSLDSLEGAAGAERYVLDFGIEAWRSVEGALGWLRKK